MDPILTATVFRLRNRSGKLLKSPPFSGDFGRSRRLV